MKLIQDLHDQAQNSADAIYQEKIKTVEEQIKNKKEFYKKEEENYQHEYEVLLADCVQSYSEIIAEKQKDLQVNQEMLNSLQSAVTAAVEAAKRAELAKNQVNFYRLDLPTEDIKEIECLRSVIPQLRNPEALNKVIWKVYYEKPYTDLIGRVVGTTTKTGIYKITNLENSMCYVGQAANVADRWRQHIKRGIGAETPTRNKLYPAMQAFGVENFSFELIEECDRAKLDEREDFWQEYFKAKEFGYSIK